MSPTPASGTSRGHSVVDGPGGDLDTRGKVHDVVVNFYREVVFDPLLGPMFDEVAEVDWAVHIPKLIDYWCQILLREPGYDGYILRPHQRVHELCPLGVDMFDRWYLLWAGSIDAHWAGPHADRAKTHAARIADVLSRRVTGHGWSVPGRDE